MPCASSGCSRTSKSTARCGLKRLRSSKRCSASRTPSVLPDTALQPSVNREQLLGAVETPLRELETLCGRLERALVLRRWQDLETAISDSRRVTHALQNAMDDARSVRDAAFDASVQRRLYYVHAIRQNQMERLQQYHDAVGERLRLVARWKSALKSIAGRVTPSRAAALNQLT